MPFDIKEFKSHISESGTLPTNKFEVEIPVPRVLWNTEVVVNNSRRPQVGFDRTLSFRAESVRAPGVTMQTTQVNRYGYGPQQKFPYNANFTDTSMTFIADKESLVWTFFYNWLNNVFAYTSPDASNTESYLNYRSNYMWDYAVDSKIHIYDNDGKLSTTLQMFDFYPVSMNDIAFGWSDNNQAKRVTVTFAFRHWRFTNVTTTDGSTKTRAPDQLIIPKGSNVVDAAANATINAVKSIVNTAINLIPSDIRLKKNIVYLKTLNNGIKLYKFEYIWSDIEYIGVMAQDILKIMPEAVHKENGYYSVNYNALDIKMSTYKEYMYNTYEQLVV